MPHKNSPISFAVSVVINQLSDPCIAVLVLLLQFNSSLFQGQLLRILVAVLALIVQYNGTDVCKWMRPYLVRERTPLADSDPDSKRESCIHGRTAMAPF